MSKNSRVPGFTTWRSARLWLIAAILSGVLWLLIAVVTLIADPSGRQVLQVVGAAAFVSGFSFALVTENRRRNRT